MKTIVFDKFCFKSNAASAQIIRSKFRRGLLGDDPIIFCCDSGYRDSKRESFPEDKLCVTESRWRFTSILRLYLGFYFYCLHNKSEISQVISMSSPGTNLLLMFFIPRAIRVRYYVQDVFPDGKLWAKGMFWANRLHVPITRLLYRRIDELITISGDMATYIWDTYGVSARVEENPAAMSDDAVRRIREVSQGASKHATPPIFFFSGNFSHAHGYEMPKLVFESIARLGGILWIHGFGPNMEKLKEHGLLSNECFGDPMTTAVYEEKLGASDVHVIFQGDGYQNFCFSSKFTSLKPIGKTLLYVGPRCGMSEEIELSLRGVCIFTDDDYETVVRKIKSIFTLCQR